MDLKSKLENVKGLPLGEKIKELKRILNETQDSELKKRILKELEDTQLEEELQEWKGKQVSKVNLKDLIHEHEEESLDKAVIEEQKKEDLKYKEEEEKLGKDLYKPGSHKEEESLYKPKESFNAEEKTSYTGKAIDFKDDEEKEKKKMRV